MLLVPRKFTENMEGLQNRPRNLSKRSNLQKLVFFCLKTQQQLSQIKRWHISLLAKHINFLVVFVFTGSYKLLLQVGFCLANHTVGSEVMFKSWTPAGVISQ